MSVKNRNPSRFARRDLRSAQRFSNVGPLSFCRRKRLDATYRCASSWPAESWTVPTSDMMSAFARVTRGARAATRRAASARRGATGAPRTELVKEMADDIGATSVQCVLFFPMTSRWRSLSTAPSRTLRRQLEFILPSATDALLRESGIL